jgi:hypothetical protein
MRSLTKIKRRLATRGRYHRERVRRFRARVRKARRATNGPGPRFWERGV